MLNIGKLASRLGYFVKTGKDNNRKNNLANFFASINEGKKEEQKPISNERWILLDAVDSGLSVDNIVEIKRDLFYTIFEFESDKEIYIIVSANEYEMARGEKCLDVHNMKYVKLKDYDEYRELVLKSREEKDKRYAAEGE